MNFRNSLTSRVLRVRKIAIYWVPVLLWMVVIYSASGDKDSAVHSSRLIAPILKFLIPGISDAGIAEGIFLGRKLAHVTVYGVLAGLLWVAFMGTFELKPNSWNWRPVLWTMTLIVIYAVSDEFHQRFVPTRQGTPWDVLIDTGGGALCIAIIWAGGKWMRKW